MTTANPEPTATATALPERAAALTRYHTVRARTLELTTGLTAEDQQVQSMPDASPTSACSSTPMTRPSAPGIHARSAAC